MRYIVANKFHFYFCRSLVFDSMVRALHIIINGIYARFTSFIRSLGPQKALHTPHSREYSHNCPLPPHKQSRRSQTIWLTCNFAFQFSIDSEFSTTKPFTIHNSSKRAYELMDALTIRTDFYTFSTRKPNKTDLVHSNYAQRWLVWRTVHSVDLAQGECFAISKQNYVKHIDAAERIWKWNAFGVWVIASV